MFLRVFENAETQIAAEVAFRDILTHQLQADRLGGGGWPHKGLCSRPLFEQVRVPTFMGIGVLFSLVWLNSMHRIK